MSPKCWYGDKHIGSKFQSSTNRSATPYVFIHRQSPSVKSMQIPLHIIHSELTWINNELLYCYWMTSASGCHPIALFKLWTMWALTGSAQPFPRAMPSSRSLKLQGRMRFTSHPIIFTFSWNQQKGFRIGEITVLIGFKGKCQKNKFKTSL